MPNTAQCKDLSTGTVVDVPVEKLTQRLAVYGVLLKDNRILFAKGRHGYVLPGGKVEIGETLEGALEREFFEETGLRIGVGSLLGATQDFYISAYDKNSYQAVSLIYSCSDPVGELSTNQFSEYEKEFYEKAEWVLLSDVEKISSAYPTLPPDVLRKITP